MKTQHIITALILGASLQFTSAAQDLDREITIDRDIVPAQRAAARPVVFPALSAPQVKANPLTLREPAQPTPITPGLGLFEPATTGGVFPLSPWRGYADLGYFPAVNASLSAGYDILSTDRQRLNLWLQANNRSYKADKKHDLWDGHKWNSFDFTFGAAFAQRFGKYNILKIATDLSSSSWKAPEEWTVTDKGGNFRWNFGAGFDGRINPRMTYGAAARFGIFNNRKIKDLAPAAAPSVNETSYAIGAWMRGEIGTRVAYGVRLDGEFFSYNHFQTSEMLLLSALGDNMLTAQKGKTIGKIDATPFVEYNSGIFTGHLEADLGSRTGQDEKFHVAPRLSLALNPGSMFGLWVKLNSGYQANNLARMFEISRYADPRATNFYSDLDAAIQVGFRVGPFHGASLTLTGDYANSDNWASPVSLLNDNANTPYAVTNLLAPVKVKGAKFGARIDWEFRSLLSLAVQYETATGGDNDLDEAWIEWYDRARSVLSAEIALHPLKPLTVDLGFEGRFRRRQLTCMMVPWQPAVNAPEATVPMMSYAKLRDMVNLRLGAAWQFTPQLTGFVRLDNLLNKRTDLIFNAPAQGFTGLFGVGYKF